MMKKFILIVCGSFVGVWLALTFFVLSAIIMSFAIVGMSMSGSSPSVKKHSILHLELSSIDERSGGSKANISSFLSGDTEESIGLDALVAAINNAAENDDVDGIYIDCQGVTGAPATLQKVRRALKEYKAKSGKWIYAYGNQGISLGDYFLASVADSIFINPYGAIDIHGLGAAIPYMKNAYKKAGIEMQVLRVGTFKSAVEPYMLDSISPANRLQTEHYLGQIWNTFCDSISKDRKITVDRFKALADRLLITEPTDSLLAFKLVDKVCYPDEMEKRLKKLTQVEEKDDLNLVSVSDLSGDFEGSNSGEHIAVLYAVGEIDGGGGGLLGDDSGIDSEEIVKSLKELASNDDVKGLVLRVNSPGGSAFGSEQMWHALEEFKKTGKPVAVSMGDYAASGGYYMSCGADRIFAEPTTITGSIGIFGMIPCAEELYRDKLNIVVSEVGTNKNSTMGAGMFGIPAKRLTPYQQEQLQAMINRGYDLFTRRCADGRKVSQDSIKQIAEGRVWDGITAKKIGLVDEFGDIDAAVKWVAKKAKLEGDPKTYNYPEPKDQWQEMLNKYMAQQYEARLRGQMGPIYELHKQVQAVLHRDHVLCLMEPFEIQ